MTSRPSIVLDIPFERNGVFDFTQLAEAKYGFEAIHPNVVTADDILDDDDGDDQDDQDNDDEEDQETKDGSALRNQPAQGVSDDNSASAEALGAPGTSNQTPPPAARRPKRKVGKYDLNDPFIDDTEMQWEATAAATRDGFFVYSGLFEVQSPAAANEKETKKGAKRKKDPDSAAQAPKRRKATKKKTKDDAKDDAKDAEAGREPSAEPEKPGSETESTEKKAERENSPAEAGPDTAAKQDDHSASTNAAESSKARSSNPRDRSPDAANPGSGDQDAAPRSGNEKDPDASTNAADEETSKQEDPKQ